MNVKLLVFFVIALFATGMKFWLSTMSEKNTVTIKINIFQAQWHVIRDVKRFEVDCATVTAKQISTVQDIMV